MSAFEVDMSQIIRTVQDIVLRSFWLTRVYSPKNPPDNAQLQEGVNLLNFMFDDFSKDGVYIPVNTYYEFDLEAGKADYTFSNTVDADFNQPMIVDLVSCYFIIQNVQQPITIFQPEQMAGIPRISNLSAPPGGVVLDKQEEFSKLTFYPKPDQTYPCKIIYKSILNSVQLNDNLTNVPNYCHMFLIYALGSFICDFYSNAVWDEKKQKKLQDLEAQIAAANTSVIATPASIELRPVSGIYGPFLYPQTFGRVV